jgi:WD40 repeat protein
VIRRVTPEGSVSILAGTVGVAGNSNGAAGAALFKCPSGLALDQNGNIYVGDTGNYLIRKITPDGKESVFFDPSDKYIWSLTYDPATSTLYAGTGDKGVIYKITPDGNGTVFYKTSATHATALAFDKAGNLLVGTGTPGKVFRLDADGKPFVLLDSGFQEVRALRFDESDNLFVAALNGRPSGGPTSTVSEPVDRPAAELTVGLGRSDPLHGTSARDQARAAHRSDPDRQRRL